jgi:hypothetical protein
MTASRRAWALWAVILFAVFNSGVSHEEMLENAREMREGRLELSLGSAATTLRAYFTDDWDSRRYLAYCSAALGRRFDSGYVRTMEAWLAEFQSDADGEGAAPSGLVTTGRALVPYREFAVEYPPGFFLWAVPPALLTADPEAFRVLFATWMGLLLTLALLACRRLAPLLSAAPSAPALVGWAAAGAAALGVVTTHRFDAAIALLLCATFWAAFSGRPALAGVLLGAAIATKLTPVLVAPVLAIELWQGRRRRELAVAAGATVASTAALLAPGFLLAGSHFADLVGYHAGRPLQLESTWGALLGLWRVVEPGSARVVKTFGSSNLVGDHAGFFVSTAVPLSAVGLLAVWVVAWRRLSRAPSPEARRALVLAAAVASLVVFMVCGKVFSPQYLVWLLPLGLVSGLQRGRKDALIFVAILAASQVIFPGFYGEVERLTPWMCALVLARNLSLAAWALWPLWRRPGPASAAASAG